MHGEVLEDLEDLDEQNEMLRERNTEVAYPESRNDLMWVRVCRDSVIPFIQNQGRSSLLQGDGWFVIKNGMKTVLSILLHLSAGHRQLILKEVSEVCVFAVVIT